MLRRAMTIYVTAVLFIFGASAAPVGAAPSKVGFLVVAPDRGYLGNQEVHALVKEFKHSYPAALGLIVAKARPPNQLLQTGSPVEASGNCAYDSGFRT